MVAVHDARSSSWWARGGPEMSPYRTEVVAVTVPPNAVTCSSRDSSASFSQLHATSGSSGSMASLESRSAWM
ncbi:Uncharacterised protein [Mycobacterium tuberculosis]|nr:Uncharacterised protein [Mycobacterium tuberculosis]